jgi:hypothetical protein
MKEDRGKNDEKKKRHAPPNNKGNAVLNIVAKTKV